MKAAARTNRFFRHWLVWAALGATLLTIGFPIAALFLQSIFPKIAGGSLEGMFAPYVSLFQTAELGVMWRNSLVCAVLTTVFAMALGIPAGWLLGRTDIPAKSVLRVSLLLPVMSPPYLLALGYVLLLQRNGIAGTFFGGLPEWVDHFLFGVGGVVLVMGLAAFGTVALIVEAALRGISTRLEDAALCLGASPVGVFRRVTLPLLYPALLNGGVLVFVDALSNFGIAAVLGSRAGLVLLPSVIYDLITIWPTDVPLAAAISAILAITAMVLVSLARFAIGARAWSGGGVKAGRLVRLGAFWKSAGLFLFAALFALSSLLPNATVLLMSLIGRWRGGNPSFTLDHYRGIWTWGSGGLQALATSAGLGAAAATACVILGGVIAYALSRHRGAGAALLDQLSMLPRVLPNLVLAVGLILAWNNRWVPVPVYGTLAIVFLAYVAIYQAVAIRFADSGMRQLSLRLEQAAACLGAPGASIFKRIIFPILAPGLFVAWISIFVMCLRDWVASIMLLPPGAQTVGSFIFSQFEQGDYASAMAMSVCTVVFSTVLLVAANQRFFRASAP